jgi:hypothetical protein
MSRTATLIREIRDGDDASVEDAVRTLSQSRRILAPLAFAVGALVMLFDGVKLLLSNWRLTLVQLLPAMWIWIAHYDLKLHAFRGKSFHVLRGPVLVPIVLGVVAVTTACFFLNAVFGFAISAPPPPRIRPAFRQARNHSGAVLGFGMLVGLLLAFSAVVVDRWGGVWFAICMTVSVLVMSFCYVAVPARLLGGRPRRTRRDKVAASAVSGTVGALICTPPHLIARIGILMLGSSVLFIPGIFVLTLGVTVQAGATGAVKAIKMSTKLVALGPASTNAAADPTPTTSNEPAEKRAEPVPERGLRSS